MAAGPSLATLGIDVELTDDEITVKRLDAIGDAGEKSMQKVVTSTAKAQEAMDRQRAAAQEAASAYHNAAVAMEELGPATRDSEVAMAQWFAERKKATQDLIETQRQWSAESAKIRTSTKQEAVDLTATAKRWDAYTNAAGLSAKATKETAQAAQQSRATIVAHTRALEIDAAMTRVSEAAERKMALAHIEAIKLNENNGKAATRASVGINTLRSSMTSLAQQALQTAPGVAQVTGVLGSMALGSAATVGIMAGIAAIGLAWNKLTADAKRLKEETQAAIAKLDELAKRRLEGPAGSTPSDVGKTSADIARLQQELAAEQASKAFAESAAGKKSGLDPGVYTARIESTRADIERLKGLVKAGEQSITEAYRDAARQNTATYASDLAALINANRSSATLRQEALALIKQNSAEIANLEGGGPAGYARRAELIAQNKQLSDSLNPPKEAAKDARDAAKAMNEWADAQARFTKFQRDQQAQEQAAVGGLQEERKNAESLLAAIKQGTAAYEAQAGALADIKTVRAAGISILSDEYAGAIANARATREANTAIGEQKTLIDAIGASAKQAAEDIKRITKEWKEGQQAGADAAVKRAEEMRHAWIDSIRDITTNGLKSFESFFESVYRSFLRMMKLMEDHNQTGTFAYKALGIGAAALGGGFTGYAAGQNIGSPAGGALAGALGGAAAGAGIAGPIGAIVGGLVGLTAGLLGGAKAARERAEAEHQLQVALYANIEQLRAQLGIVNAVNAALAQSHTQFEQLRRQTEEALSGRRNEQERNRVLAELNDLERRRTEQLIAEAKQLVINDALERARQNQRAGEDYNARILAASGQGSAADDARFAAAQRREFEEAMEAYNAGKISSQTLDDLKRALGLEKSQREQQKQTALMEEARRQQEEQLRAQTDALNGQLRVQQDIARTQESLLSETRKVADGLRQSALARLINPALTPLSPTAQYQEAGRQLQEIFNRALLGDKGSGSQFIEQANAFLQTSKEYNASTQAYAEDFNRIQAMTAQLTDQFDFTASIQEQQLAETQKQTLFLQTQIDLLAAQLYTLQHPQTYIKGALGDPNYYQINAITPFAGLGGPLSTGYAGTAGSPVSGASVVASPDVVAAVERLALRVDKMSQDLRIAVTQKAS